MIDEHASKKGFYTRQVLWDVHVRTKPVKKKNNRKDHYTFPWRCNFFFSLKKNYTKTDELVDFIAFISFSYNQG